jgi:hypothetical protein
LELQKKLFHEYLEAEGLGLFDDVPSFKPKSSQALAEPSIAKDVKPTEEAIDVGPDPFDLSRKHCVDLDQETHGLLVSLR